MNFSLGQPAIFDFRISRMTLCLQMNRFARNGITSCRQNSQIHAMLCFFAQPVLLGCRRVCQHEQAESGSGSEHSKLKRKITAILAADIAEYTRLISEDEEETLTRLEAWRKVFDEFVHRAGGRIFNTAGDGVMCEFASAVEATRCAIDIQESLRTSNMAYPASRQMHFRIGISIGDVVDRDGDLLGDGVNIAARLQGLAEPGSICVSRNVHEAVMNKVSVPFRDLGNREVKNLPHPVHAFQIEMGAQGKPIAGSSPLRRQGEAAKGGRLPMGWIAAALAAVIGGAGLFVAGRGLAPQVPAPGNPPATGNAQQVQTGQSGTVSPAPVVRGPGNTETASHGSVTISPSTGPSASGAQKPGTSVVVTENLTPAQAFEKLAQSGGIVREAKTAPELYHNARSFEARGESAAARRDYLAFAALGTDHLDPLLRLAALLRTQDGRAGAREVFTDLSKGITPDKGSGRAAALVHVLQFDGQERRTRLAAFAEANPDFAPVHALIAQEFGEDRQNAQTIADRRSELAATGRFLTAEREGRLIPFFLDQSVLGQWLDRARKREALLKAFFAENRDRIGAQFMRSNAGWMANVSLPEAATIIEYKFGTMPDFRPTGTLQLLDQRTGKPMPNPSFELPANQGQTDIALRYADADGNRSIVSTISFEPRASLVASQRDILDRFSNAWIAFGEGHNQHLLYYTHLISYRCAIQRAEIGFNGEAPTQLLPIPPCDEANPHALPANMLPYLRIKPDIVSATLRLTYVGGEISEVKSFQRKP